MIAAAVAAGELRAMKALDAVEVAALAEVSAAQDDGFVSEEERKSIDGRLTRVSVLLGALLESFGREVASAVAAKEGAAVGRCRLTPGFRR